MCPFVNLPVLMASTPGTVPRGLAEAPAQAAPPPELSWECSTFRWLAGHEDPFIIPNREKPRTPPPPVGSYISSLNEVIDLHAQRLALGVRNRIPSPIWAALNFMAVLGTAAMGYHAGLAGSGWSLAIVALVLALSAVMALIADLDRPQAGLLRVSQQTMIDLHKDHALVESMKPVLSLSVKTADTGESVGFLRPHPARAA